MKTSRFVGVYNGYKIASAVLGLAAVGYLALLAFPGAIFARTAIYGRFEVHSREELDPAIEQVLAKAESKLLTSPLYDETVQRRLYLTESHALYNFLSHKAYNSFANSVPLIDNVFINRTDVPADLVFIKRDYSNSRSLSGVIAHETTHLFIRKRYGTLSASLMPAWKNEGYCEYVAGDSTIPLDEGIRRWRENPSDDTTYRYVKYHLMVKHLLEKENMTVGDLFTKPLDEKEIADRTFATLDG